VPFCCCFNYVSATLANNGLLAILLNFILPYLNEVQPKALQNIKKEYQLFLRCGCLKMVAWNLYNQFG
jgi:hypothetical protein